jgi:predicted Zn-dependent peptidase
MRSSRLNVAGPAAALVLAASVAGATQKPQITVQELTLPNGMRWLLYENHDSPTVAAGWTARVGSVNEREGITGISHFFEHMMFKGTRTIGTKNIDEDLRLIEEQETVREAMRTEMALLREKRRRGEIDDPQKPESWTERYRDLDRQFDELVQKQRAIVVKDELDRIYTTNGGEFLNAFTNEDQTAYFVRVPANRLELWAWLESDRLLFPVFREFYSERDVVFEERRLRTESTPLGRYDEAFNALFWEASPYRWPVVGWASDIPMYTLAQAKQYFATYYAPNNITGVLCGDFEPAKARGLVDRYFGRIPRGAVEPAPVVTDEPKQIGEKRYNAEAETSPTVRIWWKGVPFVHRDGAALDVLADLLSGRTGRLYKGLVRGRQVANQVSSAHSQKRYGGVFEVEVTVKDDKEPAAAEAAVYEELERLQTEPAAPEELQKVKNQEKAEAFRRLSNPTFIMYQLLAYDAAGDWRTINDYADRVDTVTAGDVQRVAKQYLTKESRTVGTFVRKETASAEDPEVARMQQMAGQAPAEAKPAIDIILRRAGERLQALSREKR